MEGQPGIRSGRKKNRVRATRKIFLNLIKLHRVKGKRENLTGKKLGIKLGKRETLVLIMGKEGGGTVSSVAIMFHAGKFRRGGEGP